MQCILAVGFQRRDKGSPAFSDRKMGITTTTHTFSGLRPEHGLWRLGASLVFALAFGAIVTYFATSPRPPTPTPQPIQTEQAPDGSNTDMYAVVQYVKEVDAEYTTPQISTVALKIFPKVPIANTQANISAPNGTLFQFLGEPTSEEQDGWRTWKWTITVNHNGHIGRLPQALEVHLRYVVVSPVGGSVVLKDQAIPINPTVEMLDFPLLFYLGMIATGIIASYYFAEGSKIQARIKQNFGEIKRPIIWIVFSLILTPVVYLQFRQAAGPVIGDQALLLLISALPFGAGLDLAVGKAAAERA